MDKKDWDLYEMELAKDLLIASFPESHLETEELVNECAKAAHEFVKAFKP